MSCRQHTLAHIHQVRAQTLSHRTYVLGPTVLPDPFWDNVVCSICQIGMTRWGYTVAKSGDNSLSPWSICPLSRVKFKPEQGRTCSQLSSTSTTQWSQCTLKQWEDREQVATDASSEGRATRWWVADPPYNWTTDLGRDTHSSCAAIQLQRCLGLKWVCHYPKVTFSWLKHSRRNIWILISLYIWKENLPSLYKDILA